MAAFKRNLIGAGAPKHLPPRLWTRPSLLLIILFFSLDLSEPHILIVHVA